MNQLSTKRIKRIFTLAANVVCNLSCVKTNVLKICSYSLGLFICASLFMAAPAHAEDANTRAILNSTQLLNLLGGVEDDFRPILMRAIQDGEVKRAEPTFPVWIISSDTGNLLYYQGQKEFVGQAASRLVDDNGFRFGQRAFEMARSSRSTWVKVVLGGKEFRGYCAAKAPFVVCSLIP